MMSTAAVGSRVVSVRLAAALAMLSCSTAIASAGADVPDYDFNWAIITDPGNPAYDGSLGGLSPFNIGAGSVDYSYRISRLELTSAQWLPFINIFSQQSESPGLFGRPTWSGLEPIPGPPGRWRLDPNVPNAAMVGVRGLDWLDAAMYCNWLHNGKPTDIADIMYGAYDLLDENGELDPSVERSPDAQFFLPNFDEWMKAAHWDPNRHGDGKGGWWRYSHMSDDPPVPGLPGAGQTSAGDFLPTSGEYFIPLGAYEDVVSPWGLWDVSGGNREYLDDPIFNNRRGVEGSSANDDAPENFMFDHVGYAFDTSFFGGNGGIRVASIIPSPGGCSLFGGLTLFFLSRRKRP